MVARFILGIPESPAWLASIGEIDKANELVKMHIGTEYKVVPQERSSEKKVSVAELFTPKYRKNTLVGGIFFATQVFTFFGVGIFLPILVRELQIGNASTSSIIYMVFVLVGAFLGTYLCNRMPRRRFLISTYYIATASLIVMILSQEKMIVVTGIAFAVFALVMSVAVVIENPYPPELFDDRVRGTGVGVVVAFSRVGAAGGTFLMPTLVQNIGVYGTLAVCMATLLIGGVVCHLWAPETSINHIHENSKQSPQENLKKELV